ncbi:sodium-coupled monocarboxylate transporter 1-like [Periplaneta americana]|uniref:sodium-coupled monocarboxylate transporter 1-like n=1 Tax=Periplaneta americana TaxID=6978 RepID=UPI0037E7BF82
MVIDQEHTNLVQQHLFGWLDYTLLVVMLVATSLIGLYFGVWGKKSDTTEEYLHGSKNLRVIPVAVSLVVSFLSGIVTMGAPTEIYLYGTLHWLICVDFVLVAIVTYHVYLPVFYDLKITSMYEYLEMRFNRSVRVIASSLWTFHQLLINSVVIYVPALAVSRVARG